MIGVAKMEAREPNLRQGLQKWRPESQICDRGRKNGGQRAKSAIGVAKMEAREPNLRYGVAKMQAREPNLRYGVVKMEAREPNMR